ncbi:MAG: hypothetical protein WCC84_01870 [Candidatus Cybelea sp.]
MQSFAGGPTARFGSEWATAHGGKSKITLLGYEAGLTKAYNP